jgi:hypothetical protein
MTARLRLRRSVVNTWTARLRLRRSVVNTWTTSKPRRKRAIPLETDR